MRVLLLACALCLAAVARALASTTVPGLYDVSGKPLYVGIEHELPDPAQNDFLDPRTGRTGELRSMSGLHLRCGIREDKRVMQAPQGRLGVSLYYIGNKPRTTVILIHGNDAESRDMGFIIPYFVCNGINVLSYDQRGVGESSGNWFLAGPVQKAQDVVAIYDAFRGDRHVDPRKIGVWGFSNGGWTAPIVTLRRRIAFMILKSAATESVLSNLDYEVSMEMRRHHESGSATAQALNMWHTVEQALYGKVAWSDAGQVLSMAEKQAWFPHSLMPKLDVPPAPATVDGLRRAFTFDPTGTLLSVTTPTLALYGAFDRRVDSADSSAHMGEYLRRAGAKDVTIKMFANAGHTLFISKNGFDADRPERFAPGYPEIMITWLRERGFTKEPRR